MTCYQPEKESCNTMQGYAATVTTRIQGNGKLAGGAGAPQQCISINKKIILTKKDFIIKVSNVGCHCVRSSHCRRSYKNTLSLNSLNKTDQKWRAINNDNECTWLCCTFCQGRLSPLSLYASRHAR
jgi:hypothetical protein